MLSVEEIYEYDGEESEREQQLAASATQRRVRASRNRRIRLEKFTEKWCLELSIASGGDQCGVVDLRRWWYYY